MTDASNHIVPYHLFHTTSTTPPHLQNHSRVHLCTQTYLNTSPVYQSYTWHLLYHALPRSTTSRHHSSPTNYLLYHSSTPRFIQYRTVSLTPPCIAVYGSFTSSSRVCAAIALSCAHRSTQRSSVNCGAESESESESFTFFFFFSCATCCRHQHHHHYY